MLIRRNSVVVVVVIVVCKRSVWNKFVREMAN